MSHIALRGKKWFVEVCISGQRKSKTFESRDGAEAWAAIQEGKVNVSPIIGKALSSLHLVEEEIIANALPYMRIQGIYFLVKGAEIVYIGKSRHLMRRIAQHENRNVDFDGYYFILAEEARATVLEEYYIKKFQPKLNTVYMGKQTQIEELGPQWIEVM